MNSNNTKLTHYIAVDHEDRIYGSGRTLAECYKDAQVWAGDDVLLHEPHANPLFDEPLAGHNDDEDACWDRHAMNILRVYRATKAAYDYIQLHGADTDASALEFGCGGVSLAT